WRPAFDLPRVVGVAIPVHHDWSITFLLPPVVVVIVRAELLDHDDSGRWLFVHDDGRRLPDDDVAGDRSAVNPHPRIHSLGTERCDPENDRHCNHRYHSAGSHVDPKEETDSYRRPACEPRASP